MATTEQRAANRTDGSSGVFPERADGLLPEEEQLFKEFQAYVRSITNEITRSTLQVLEHGIQSQIESIVKTTSNLDETVKRSREDYRNLFSPAIDTFRTGTNELLARFSSAINSMTTDALSKIDHSMSQAKAEVREQIKTDQVQMINEMAAWREQITTDQAALISKMTRWFIIVTVIASLSLAALVAVLLIHR